MLLLPFSGAVTEAISGSGISSDGWDGDTGGGIVGGGGVWGVEAEALEGTEAGFFPTNTLLVGWGVEVAGPDEARDAGTGSPPLWRVERDGILVATEGVEVIDFVCLDIEGGVLGTPDKDTRFGLSVGATEAEAVSSPCMPPVECRAFFKAESGAGGRDSTECDGVGCIDDDGDADRDVRDSRDDGDRDRDRDRDRNGSESMRSRVNNGFQPGP